MAKIVGTYAAIKHYELIADEVDRRVDPAVPRVIDALHAGVLGPQPWTGVQATIAGATEPVFLFGRREFRAVCGQYVQLILPEPFDPEIAKACPQCAETLAALAQ